MSENSRQKDKARAAYLKKIGDERTSGRCPWGCGAVIRNGGAALIAHLNICHGPRR